jgi:hypothetical protein
MLVVRQFFLVGMRSRIWVFDLWRQSVVKLDCVAQVQSPIGGIITWECHFLISKISTFRLIQFHSGDAAMNTRTKKFVTSLAPISLSFLLASTVSAAADSPALDDPPQIAAPAQRWLSHQDWICLPNKSYDPKKYILGIRERMNTLGQLGWEVVNFTQVMIANKSCYVVTFKTPYEMTK